MTVLYIILTLVFIWTQVYMLKVIWKRGKEIAMWKKSVGFAEERETHWYKKHNLLADEYATFRQKHYPIQSSRWRLADAIVKRRILPSIKEEAKEIINA